MLSAVKVVLKLMENINNSDKIRSFCRKLAPPLISLMSTEAEMTYVAIRNINLILMRYPSLFEKEVRIFFCNFQDPLYVKLAKLDLIVKLAQLGNVD